MTRTVVVRGERFELALEQKSQSDWRASGSYKGKLLQSTGRNAETAAARWRESAHHPVL